MILQYNMDGRQVGDLNLCAEKIKSASSQRMMIVENQAEAHIKQMIDRFGI